MSFPKFLGGSQYNRPHGSGDGSVGQGPKCEISFTSCMLFRGNADDSFYTHVGLIS